MSETKAKKVRTQVPSRKGGGGQTGTTCGRRARVRLAEAGFCACEHVFVSIKGSAYARFRRALETDSASLATAAAYELPQLNLADALRLCLVYARADRSRFERAIVRWHARLCLEAKSLDLPTGQIALAAAAGLAGPQLSEVAVVLDEWAHRGAPQRPGIPRPPIGGGG